MTPHRIPLTELEKGIPFEQRHIGPDLEARAKMLAQVGYGSLDELTAAAVPDVIKNQLPRHPPRCPGSPCSRCLRSCRRGGPAWGC